MFWNRNDGKNGTNGRSRSGGGGWIEGRGARVEIFSTVGFAAEDVVRFVEDHVADFFFGKGAFFFSFFGGGEGLGVGDLLEVSRGAGEASEGVELADVVGGVGVEFVLFEGLKDLAEADVDDGLGEFEVGGVGIEVGGVFAGFAELIEEILVGEPCLVAAFFP